MNADISKNFLNVAAITSTHGEIIFLILEMFNKSRLLPVENDSKWWNHSKNEKIRLDGRSQGTKLFKSEDE